MQLFREVNECLPKKRKNAKGKTSRDLPRPRLEFKFTALDQNMSRVTRILLLQLFLTKICYE